MQFNQKHEEEVKQVLDTLRPAMEADGGGVEFHSIKEDGTVCIKLKGACLSCPSSSLTLKFGIEMSLKNKLSWVTGIQRIHDDSNLNSTCSQKKHSTTS